MSRKTADAEGSVWFVYILRCADRSLYTGITTDLNRRTDQHNSGVAARYTRSRLPVRVAYQEPHPCRSSALRREWAIKAMARRDKESLVRTTSLTHTDQQTDGLGPRSVS